MIQIILHGESSSPKPIIPCRFPQLGPWALVAPIAPPKAPPFAARPFEAGLMVDTYGDIRGINGVDVVFL